MYLKQGHASDEEKGDCLQSDVNDREDRQQR